MKYMSPQLRLRCAQGFYIHACMQACIHTYLHTYIHTDIYIYIYLQVRFHRNIATSSLAADCNVPQRPPAIIRNFTSIQMVHPHTHTHARIHAGTHARKWFWATHKWILHIREDTGIIPGFTTSALELHRFGRTSWQGAEPLDGGPGKP